MGGKKAAGENTKKVAGNARKAEAAAQKQAEAEARLAAADEEKWSKGAKEAKKKQEAADKAAEKAAKKAEREALLAEEEKNQRSTPKGANKKTAEKKTRTGTLDLGQLDGEPSAKDKAISASGIDNALDALSLTTGPANDLKLDRHPERRYKAAYKAYEERRLPQIEVEHPGLRKQQRIEIVRKEFEKSEENPFNQAGNIRFDATKDELAETRKKVKEGVEKRLVEK
ncbi:hypothetical protein A1O1_04766 [Capronia coronata CBS 617.96]|uniref:DUF1014 domain-containing protein n=1 Tax=Capronia coronata CBS 617.96 TaxID=1182541 RepID=W9Z000_9EURO|nr:uncharacterized protein A1O1_04766 [Capronia coronata CBS 617.96]EXJ87839.1 hypothetical protein A1O1_04766 [Capronia coronata CBS 617.96]